MKEKKQVIAKYWADRLQVDVEIVAQLMRDAAVDLFCKSKAVKLDRVIAYRHGDSSLILLPETISGAAETAIKNELAQWLGKSEMPSGLPVRRLWRDFIWYRTTPITESARSQPIRILTKADGAKLSQLQERCSEADVEMGEVGIDDPVAVGYFAEDALAGVASFLYTADERIADVGVLVDPAFRKQGIAAALVSRLTNLGVADGKIVQYMATEGNRGSVRTAEHCGFALWFVEDGFELIG